MSSGEGFPSQVISRWSEIRRQEKGKKNKRKRRAQRNVEIDKCLENVRAMQADPVTLAELRGKCWKNHVGKGSAQHIKRAESPRKLTRSGGLVRSKLSKR